MNDTVELSDIHIHKPSCQLLLSTYPIHFNLTLVQQHIHVYSIELLTVFFNLIS